MVSLNQFVKQVGFGFAVALQFEKLTDEFLEKLSFEEWNEVFEATPEWNKIKAIAFKHMQKKARTRAQLLKILKICFRKKITLPPGIIKKIKDKSITFKHWQELLDVVYRIICSTKEPYTYKETCHEGLKAKALAELVRLATKYKELLYLCYALPVNSKHWKKVISAIQSLKLAPKQWQKIYSNTSSKKLRKVAAKHLVTPETSFRRCLGLNSSLGGGEKLERAILNELKSRDLSFAQYHELSYEGGCLGELALRGMENTAKTYGEWQKVYWKIKNEDLEAAEKILRTKLLPLGTIKNLKKLLGYSSFPQKHSQIVFAYLRKLAN